MKDLKWVKEKKYSGCQECDIIDLCHRSPEKKCELLGVCNGKGIYKLKQAPGKIQKDYDRIISKTQTEYTKKAFRYEWLNVKGLSVEGLKKDEVKEFQILSTWLYENKPGKIQTEYEWKKERFALLLNTKREDYTPEEYKDHSRQGNCLMPWLKCNKPEQWVTCTKDNTKVGDEVRQKSLPPEKFIVEYMHREVNGCCLWRIEEKSTSPDWPLHCLEINIAGKSD